MSTRTPTMSMPRCEDHQLPQHRVGPDAQGRLDHPTPAVEQYPKARIRLRNRALVMEEHKPK